MHATIVLPTVRYEHAKAWWEAWKPQLDHHRVIMVVDLPRGEASKQGFGFKGVETYCWEDIDDYLEDDASLISRRTSAVRNFGTYLATLLDTDMIWHLDDDCLPESHLTLLSHALNLSSKKELDLWCSTDKSEDNRLRGMPYYNLTNTVKVGISHGVWSENPDYDAVHQLANKFDFVPWQGVMPLGQYFPMCGMNLAFLPWLAPLMYFAPSGPDEPYDRFDDIWMGIIAKRVMDHFRLYCWSGSPSIIHDRASDPFVNLIKEAPGIKDNEGFWTYIDNIDLTGFANLDEAVAFIGSFMEEFPYQDKPYFRAYGKKLQRWAELAAC